MRAFEIYVNGKRLCLSGIGDDGVLTAMITHVIGGGRNETHVRIGGLISPSEEHVRWAWKRLKTGDEVRLKVVSAASVDAPKERWRRDPRQDLKAEKAYVRQMTRKLGWQITKADSKGQPGRFTHPQHPSTPKS